MTDATLQTVLAALYALLFLGLAYRESRRQKDVEVYYVHGRRASAIETGFSVTASCIGASATIGMCGLAFEIGLPAVWWILSGAVGLGVLTVFLLRLIRSGTAGKALTMLEIVRGRLGEPASTIACIIILAAWSAILAAQFSAMGRVVSAMIGIEPQTALLLGAGLILFYTLLGGQAAVMRSDVLQLSVMAAGLAALLGALLTENPMPIKEMPVELFGGGMTLSMWSKFMLLIGGSYIVCPMLFTRFMSAESDRAARRGAVIGIGSLVMFAIVIVLIGVEARAFLDTPPASGDAVLPELVEKLPFWASTVFYFVMLSAILSSADSCLMTAAGVASNDLLRRPGIGLSRAMMVVLSAFALYLALGGRSVLELLFFANSMYVCAVVAPVFLALVFDRTLEPKTAAVAMTASALLAFAGEWTGNDLYIWTAVLSSVVGSVGAMLLSGRKIVMLSGE